MRSRITGIGVGRGAAVGPVVHVREASAPAPDAPVVCDVEEAFAAVSAELSARARQAGGALAEVLDATALIAADPALLTGTRRKLDAGTPPVKAVSETIAEFIELFTAVGGPMAERVADLASVRDRAIANLVGAEPPGLPRLTEPSVIVARDLAPADTAALDLANVAAIVTELGGKTSHTAIIAGQLGIPCVVRATGALEIPEAATVLVNAREGVVVVAPDSDLLVRVAAHTSAEAIFDDDDAPGATADGYPVDLLANIGTAADAEAAAAATGVRTAAGSGLFRTEVLFLDAASAPSIQAQAAEYARALVAFAGRKVCVRTLDAGADKPLAFATLADEPNPALGVRGYRIGRVHPELLSDQLVALGEAAIDSGTQPWVMAPMIATPQEAAQFAALARSCGLSYVGVMIEIPAAALRAADILAAVDFVSIGTNDLAQYTMGADRLAGQLSDLLDPWQPAVLELVARAAAAGRELGKPVGVCGESAADPLLALVLAGLGVTSLSMAPSALPAVRYALRRHTRANCEEMARAALAAPHPGGARAAVVDRLADDDVRRLLA